MAKKNKMSQNAAEAASDKFAKQIADALCKMDEFERIQRNEPDILRREKRLYAAWLPVQAAVPILADIFWSAMCDLMTATETVSVLYGMRAMAAILRGGEAR